MRRYETLMPDDIIRICKEWSDAYMEESPTWCQGAGYDSFLDAFLCPEGKNCETCLRKWLEEEIKPDPVWYSKQFIMEQVAALIAYDASDLALYHILDEVLADTPEEIRYRNVEKYFKAMEEAEHERIWYDVMQNSEAGDV